MCVCVCVCVCMCVYVCMWVHKFKGVQLCRNIHNSDESRKWERGDLSTSERSEPQKCFGLSTPISSHVTHLE